MRHQQNDDRVWVRSRADFNSAAMKPSRAWNFAGVAAILVAVWAILHAMDRVILRLAGPFAGPVEFGLIAIGLLIFLVRNP